MKVKPSTYVNISILLCVIGGVGTATVTEGLAGFFKSITIVGFFGIFLFPILHFLGKAIDER